MSSGAHEFSYVEYPVAHSDVKSSSTSKAHAGAKFRAVVIDEAVGSSDHPQVDNADNA